MKKFLLLFFLSSAFSQLRAQQLPLFTQYREYPGFVNPAAVSMDYFAAAAPERMLKVGGGSRLQWVGNESFTVATSIIHGDAFFNLGGVSFAGGGYFLQDKVDVTSMNGFYGRGAVYIGDPVYNRFWGGLGFSGGYIRHALDLRKLKAYNANDPLLSYAALDASTFDFGVGAFGVFQWDGYEKALMFGVSVPQMLEPEIRFLDDNAYDFLLPRHLFTQLTFMASTSADYGFFEATLWGKLIEGTQPHIDLNLRYQANSNVWLGIGGSSVATLHLEVGTNLRVGRTVSHASNEDNYLKIGYGFDMPFNTNYASYLGAAHELNISFVVF